MGERAETNLGDDELMADLTTAYYTDHEPGSTWVALSDGRVVGYLSGCLHTPRYLKSMFAKIGPMAIVRGMWRGLLWRRATWKWIVAGLRTWRRVGNYRNKYLAEYPAHVHLNMANGFRGKGMGWALLDKFFTEAKNKGVPGVHLAVRGDNKPAISFFEKMGFTLAERKPVIVPASKGFLARDMCVYVKRL